LVAATITPVLTVRNTAAAVAFYKAAFGAIEISRVEASDGQLVIDLAIGQARLRVVDEAPTAFNLSPETLGGTSVRFNLLVEDPDATAAHAVAAGAVEVFPIADQPYGLRQGRFADPFGHHWLIGVVLNRGGVVAREIVAAGANAGANDDLIGVGVAGETERPSVEGEVEEGVSPARPDASNAAEAS
jgi:PhnB protein